HSHPPQRHCSHRLAGAIYVFGGELPGVFADNEIYDPVADSWTQAPPMPTARHGLAAGAVDGKFYLIGGGTADVTRPITDPFACGSESLHIHRQRPPRDRRLPACGPAASTWPRAIRRAHAPSRSARDPTGDRARMLCAPVVPPRCRPRPDS
ncbi:MAG TPA: hypothetical protein EYO90_00660, partial [Candidatus Latescibacteria bacterium]|nr:hypothetical protein [Candidatus Latescibacterota bacterium]